MREIYLLDWRIKMQEAFKKMQESSKEAFEKVTKSFDADQKKAWEKLGGEKFEFKFEFPRKDKKEKKDDQ